MKTEDKALTGEREKITHKFSVDMKVVDDSPLKKEIAEISKAFQIIVDEVCNKKLKELGYATPEEHEALKEQVAELVEALKQSPKIGTCFDASPIILMPYWDWRNEILKPLLVKHTTKDGE